MKKCKPRRIIALFLTLLMLLSVGTMSATSAEAAETNRKTLGIMGDLDDAMDMVDLMSNFVNINGFFGPYGQAVAASIKLVTFFIRLGVGSGPSPEQIIYEYLQEMREEIVNEIEETQDMIQAQTVELKNFMTTTKILGGFDTAYHDVHQQFNTDDTQNFYAKVTRAIKNEKGYSDETVITQLAELIGDNHYWDDSGSTVYKIDKLKSYLKGYTNITDSGYTCYDAVTNYHQSYDLLGKEVDESFYNDFCIPAYNLYNLAVNEELICLQARVLYDREILGTESALLDADECEIRIKEMTKSLVDVATEMQAARAKIHQFDFYDRSGGSTVTRHLSGKMGKRDFVEEAKEVYKKVKGSYPNISNSDQVYAANSYYHYGLMGDKQDPKQTNYYPRVETTLSNAGLSVDSLKHFVTTASSRYPDKTLRQILTNYGFDAASSSNGSAPHFCVDARIYNQERHQCYYIRDIYPGIPQGPYGMSYCESARLTYDYYYIDGINPGYNKNVNYSVGEPVSSWTSPNSTNTPIKTGGDHYGVNSIQYLQTVNADFTYLDQYKKEAEGYLSQTNKYKSESLTALQNAVDTANGLSRSSATQTQVDNATEALIRAINTKKGTKEYYSSWEYLQTQIDNVSESGTVMLYGDTTATSSDTTLKIPSGKDITLYLGEFTLDRNLSSAKSDGTAISNNGTLTITGTGTVTGGYSNKSKQGGAITNNGTLTLSGGTYTGNIGKEAGVCFNSANATLNVENGTYTNNKAATNGGGAFVNYGTMNVSGGTISNNKSTGRGGGIYTQGPLTITGGTITGNSSNALGGGVYLQAQGTLNMSGNPVIRDNEISDVYLSPDKKINVTGELDESAQIGVLAESQNEGLVITNGLSENGTVDNFFYDNDLFLIETNSSGEAQLKDSPTEWENLQALIDNAEDGATITLEQDYSATEDDEELTIPSGKTLTIVLGSDEEHTLNADGNFRVFYNYGNLTLKGKGVLTGGNVNVNGGAIYNKGTLTVENGVLITNNSAENGGAVWNEGTLTMNGGSLTGNTANDEGGAVYSNNGTFNFNGGYVTENYAGVGGGAFYNDGSNGVLNFSGGLLTGNEARARGGAVEIYKNSTMNLTGGTITGNSCRISNGRGSGIYFNDYSFTGTLNVSGSPNVTDNEGSDINVDKTASINITGELDSSAKLGVSVAYPSEGYVVTNGLQGKGTLDNFVDSTKDYDLTLNDDGEVSIYRVPDDWTGLQEYINDAESGSTIKIYKDYTATENDDNLTIPADKTLTFDFGSGETRTLDANGIIRVFQNKGNLTLKGNGVLTGGKNEDYSGGGVKNIGTLTIEDGITISGNATRSGAGIINDEGAVTYMKGGTIKNNTANMYGGAVANKGTFTMTGGVITGNTNKNGYGGAFFNYGGGTLNLENGSITNNKTNASTGDGGAIYNTKTNDKAAVVNLKDVEISGNSSGRNGGGICMDDGSLNVSGSPVVTGNTSDDVWMTGEINVVGELDSSAKIGFKFKTPADGKVVTNGLQGNGTADNFICNTNGYKVVLNDSGEAALEKAYTITVDSIENGAVYVSDSAFAGDSVALSAVPDKGYELKSLTVTDADNNEITVENNKFTMPSKDVTITAEFKKTAPDIDSLYDPSITAGSAVLMDENLFKLPSGLVYKKASLLGVQKKEDIKTDSENTAGLRFIAEMSSEYLDLADDYGFEIVKTKKQTTKDFGNSDGFATMQNLIDTDSKNISAISCKGTTNTITKAEYGSSDADSTIYKYVTLAVKNVPDTQGLAVRFYVTIDGVRYYAEYNNEDGAFRGCCASYNTLLSLSTETPDEA